MATEMELAGGPVPMGNHQLRPIIVMSSYSSDVASRGSVSPPRRYARLPGPLGLLSAALLVLPLAAACSDATSTRREVPDELQTVVEAYERIAEQHVARDSLVESDLVHAAIEGMIEALEDPHSFFIPSERYAIQADLSGEYEGIGARVSSQDDRIVILQVLPGSPALAAGMQAGDIVTAVDGESLEGLTLFDAVLRVRGPKGTTVRVEVIHPGASGPTELSIVRDHIVLQLVESRMLEPGIGYVKITSFEAVATAQLREALERLESEGAESLVLDLRDNGGGLVSTSIEVASEFIREGVVLREVRADGTEAEYVAAEGGLAADWPLAVLVNGFTASGAEIVAGALQDYGRAVVVGTGTFGKGSINLYSQLTDGSGMRLTISRFLTPDRHAIEGLGITPDQEVLLPDTLPSTPKLRALHAQVPEVCAAYREALEDLVDDPTGLAAALETLCAREPSPPASGTDSQLDAALAHLRSRP